jgi:excisionase family DNA binding protein
MAQMKHRDARIFALAQHLKSAIEIWEQIASEPYTPPAKETEPARRTPAPPPEPIVLPPEKLTYTLKQAATALGVGKTTLYKAISEGSLHAVKLGNRTLLPAEALRNWINALPRRG